MKSKDKRNQEIIGAEVDTLLFLEFHHQIDRLHNLEIMQILEIFLLIILIPFHIMIKEEYLMILHFMEMPEEEDHRQTMMIKEAGVIGEMDVIDLVVDTPTTAIDDTPTTEMDVNGLAVDTPTAAIEDNLTTTEMYGDPRMREEIVPTEVEITKEQMTINTVTAVTMGQKKREDIPKKT